MGSVCRRSVWGGQSVGMGSVCRYGGQSVWGSV